MWLVLNAFGVDFDWDMARYWLINLARSMGILHRGCCHLAACPDVDEELELVVIREAGSYQLLQLINEEHLSHSEKS